MTSYKCIWCNRWHTSADKCTWLNDATAPRDRDNNPPGFTPGKVRVYDAPIRDHNGEAREHAANARRIPVRVESKPRWGWWAFAIGLLAGVIAKQTKDIKT